jgi:CheY-like chemotaxis protein
MPVKKPKKAIKALKNIKVMLVEDDDFLSDILYAKLTDDGGSLAVFANAMEALRSIEKNAPDIIITDLMLPGMSGEELVENVVSNERLKEIPIIVFSNKSNPVEIKELLAKGVAEYHVKAETSLKDIPKIIQRVLEKK